MDYQKELERLKENEDNLSGDYWKPEPGQHRVKSLGEIEDGTPFEKEGEESQPRKQLRIAIGENEYLWSFPLGKTPASVYGQLVGLGSQLGSLKDKEFTVVTTGSGKQIRFTIVL